MTTQLPPQANLQQQKSRAKDLLKAHGANDPGAIQRIKGNHPRFRTSTDAEILAGKFTLRDAQLVIAREVGFDNWTELKSHLTKASKPATSHAEYFAAIRANDVEKVAKLLTNDPSLVNARMQGTAYRLNGTIWVNGGNVEVDATDERNSPALHHCVLWNFNDMARLLLANGADVNALGWEDNHTHAFAMTLAAWEGSLESVKLLLDHGADPTVPTGGAHPALYTAAEHQAFDKVDLLIARGAPHDVFTASIMGDVDVLRQLLVADPMLIEARSRRGRTPVEEATHHGRTETINLLLEYGATISLEIAATIGNLARVKGYIEADASLLNPVGLPESQQTPLMAAAKAGQREVVAYLLKAGADVNLGAGNGHQTCQPIHCTATSCIGLLVKAGADINRPYRHMTPLQRASGSDQDDTKIAELIKYGAVKG